MPREKPEKMATAWVALDKKHLNFLSQKLKNLQKAHENRRVHGQLERLQLIIHFERSRRIH